MSDAEIPSLINTVPLSRRHRQRGVGEGMHTVWYILGQSLVGGGLDWTSRTAIFELGFEERSGHYLGKEGKEGHFR